MSIIDTEELSARYREKAINLSEKSISITNYNKSLQEKDLSEPANCNGFGRIRHFKLDGKADWPSNPLPIVPASKKLNIPVANELRAQVFQNSVCNWRCWYCYVDFKLLSGNSRYSRFLTCNELVDYYLSQTDPPPMIDLSGGQPDLTPEWVPWMMETLKERGLEQKVFLWSDDNLSNDYFWRFLSPAQIYLIQEFPMYARVCCFKGIDPNTFSINTKAAPELFEKQIELFERLSQLTIDLYAYITLTGPAATNFDYHIPLFLDRLQKIKNNIPLKIVPLKITEFSPSMARIDLNKADLFQGQEKAISVWIREMERRFTIEELARPITDK